MKGVLLIFCLTLFSCAFCAIVRVENGEIRGTEMTTRKGFSFDAFLKIPFAEAPVPDSPLGNLRFQPPIKKAPWTGILNATAYGPMCMQVLTYTRPGDVIHEDCLYLNVFTKNLNGTFLKSVIVYIHGGSYETGASFNHDPSYLMDREVVVVTINYRMGAFGFLAAGTEKAMGNMGLKDQVMALEWVRDNIENFGGDPDRVTITGLSAGGFSVTSLLISKMSRHLFKRVIVMSGAITWMSRMNTNYKNLAEELAKGANCTESDIVSCLQEVPAQFLVDYDVSSKTSCRYSMTWNAVVEEDFNQTKFFSRTPLEVLEDPEEDFSKIEIMIGFTEHELAYIAPYMLVDPQILKKIEEETGQFMYDCFYLKEVPKDVTRFKHLYLAYDKIDQRSFNGIAEFMSDGGIGYGSHKLVHLLSNFTDVFYYKFNYQGINSVFDFPRDSPYGVSHADDIQFVFDTWYVGPSINETHRDNFMVERMTRIWENFAYFGDPNNNTDASTAEYLDGMIWPKHDWIDEYYLEIGVHMVEKRGLNLPRYAAWDELNSESTASNVHNLILMTFISLALKLFM